MPAWPPVSTIRVLPCLLPLLEWWPFRRVVGKGLSDESRSGDFGRVHCVAGPADEVEGSFCGLLGQDKLRLTVGGTIQDM
jgi:hypothetical protein